MIFCHHLTLAFILAPNQRTWGRPSDFGVTIGLCSLTSIYIIILLPSIILSASTLVRKNETKDSMMYTGIYIMLQTLYSYFYIQMYLLENLNFIYLNTTAKYDTAWSVKESNPHAKLFRINAQMDTKQWKS